MRRMNLKSVVWKEGKYHVAQCLDIDVSSFGETRKEALSNLQEALELYFEGEGTARVKRVQRPQIVDVGVARA